MLQIPYLYWSIIFVCIFFCSSDEEIMRSLIINAHLALIEMLIYLIEAFSSHLLLLLCSKLLNSQNTITHMHYHSATHDSKEWERDTTRSLRTYVTFRYNFDFISVVLMISDANKRYFVHICIAHQMYYVKRNKISFVFRLYLTSSRKNVKLYS